LGRKDEIGETSNVAPTEVEGGDELDKGASLKNQRKMLGPQVNAIRRRNQAERVYQREW